MNPLQMSKLKSNFFQQTLTEQGVYEPASLDDVKYFFFSLPSIIIVKGYALGFTNQSVKDLIINYIASNKQGLILRKELKIQFRM